jgi:hypothetical protein
LLGQTTIGIHLREVDSAVETASKTTDVDVEGKLLAVGLEHFV